MTNLKKKLLTGGITIAITTAITALLTYLFRLILIKRLTLEDYGLFYAIISILLFSSIFLDKGYSLALLKFGSEYIKKNEVIKKLITIMLKYKIVSSLIFMLIVLSSAKFLEKYYFKHGMAAELLVVMSLIYLAINIIFSMLNVYLRMNKYQAMYGLYELTKILFQVIAIIFLVKYGLWGVVAGFFLGTFIAFVIFLILNIKSVKKIFEAKAKASSKIIKEFKIFASANVLFITGTLILNHTDNYMLTYFTDLTQVGLYNIALPTAKIMMFFLGALTLVIIPLTTQLKKTNIELLKKIVQTIYKLGLIFILPAALLLISYPELIIKILYSPDYISAANTLRVLSISAIFSIFFIINTQIINGLGKPKINSKIILFGVVMNLIINVIFIPLWGILGAAIATLMSQFIMTIMTIVKVKQMLNVILSKTYLIKFTIISILTILISEIMKNNLIINGSWNKIIIMGLITGISYIIMIIMFRIIGSNDIKEIVAIIKK